MYFFFALCALHFMQNFVTLVDPRPGLLFASKVQRVANVADDASVLEMEFGREIKLSRHAAETPSCARSSAERASASESSPANGETGLRLRRKPRCTRAENGSGVLSPFSCS